MRVLFIYKYLTLGGVETVLRARLDGLDELGVEAHAWFFHDLGGRHVFSGLEDRIRVGSAGDCLAFARSGFDLVVAIDTEEVLPSLAERRSPRLVVECHSPYLENIEYLRRLSAHPPAAVLVPSEHQRRIVRERIGCRSPVRVVANCLTDGFLAPTTAFPAPPPRPVIGWLGRLDWLKNWPAALELTSRLLDEGADVELWIAGRPVNADGGGELRERATDLGMIGRLRWFRGLPHARLPRLLDAIRDSGGVVVSTSRAESFGMGLAEAMARECTVVAPDRAPFRELVADGLTGILVPDDVAERAVEPVLGLLLDAARRIALGSRARECVLRRFAPARTLGRLVEVLRELPGAD